MYVVASCLILVGPEHRARLFAERLEYCMTIRSERGPVTFTGTYQGTPVSVMSIGMVFTWKYRLFYS